MEFLKSQISNDSLEKPRSLIRKSIFFNYLLFLCVTCWWWLLFLLVMRTASEWNTPSVFPWAYNVDIFKCSLIRHHLKLDPSSNSFNCGKCVVKLRKLAKLIPWSVVTLFATPIARWAGGHKVVGLCCLLVWFRIWETNVQVFSIRIYTWIFNYRTLSFIHNKKTNKNRVVLKNRLQWLTQ